MTADYAAFLESKIIRPIVSGFEADPLTFPSAMFDWQSLVAQWLIRIGRGAAFLKCGMGKTIIAQTWAKAVVDHTGLPVLILTPLAVAPQMIREGDKFGIKVEIVRSQAGVINGINVTNYQKLLDRKGTINIAAGWKPEAFGGVVLDESNLLASFMGKTKQMLMRAFENTPYKLCCSATPAPNDYMELGNHAQFLGVMDSDEMLSRWFINDSMNFGSYRLKKHAEKDFWQWVSTWAIYASRPSDLGFSDEGFELPPLEIHERIVEVDATEGAEGTFWRCDSLTATTIHKEMRRTAAARAAAVAAVVNTTEEQFVVWCNTDYEADALKRVLKEQVEVRGSYPDSKNEERLEAFIDGKARVLIGKPSQIGFGLNLQHCHKAAFVGLSYSWMQFYQALHRIWRYGQKCKVDAYVFCAETEGEVLKTIKRKQSENDVMSASMLEATKGTRLDQINHRRELQMVKQEVASGDNWTLHLGDCVDVTRKMDDSSIHFSIHSPPFSSLYIYSDSIADMGNSASDVEFFKHYGFLVEQLHRVTMSGRLAAVHCKDLPLYKGRDDAAGLRDFPGAIVRLFELHGWTYHSRVTIWKDPVIEMQRTKNNGLLYKTLCRDASQCRQGMADYLLVFRKFPTDGTMNSERPVRKVRPQNDDETEAEYAKVKRKKAFKKYVGEKEAVKASNIAKAGSPDTLSPDFGLEVWQRYASPVWFDIEQTDVLNYQAGRSDKDEKHICPLQLGVIERAVELWTLPGDLVYSPFAGIGSELYVSLLAGRKAIGAELKKSYWLQAQVNCEKAVKKLAQNPLDFGDDPDDARAELL